MNVFSKKINNGSLITKLNYSDLNFPCLLNYCQNFSLNKPTIIGGEVFLQPTNNGTQRELTVPGYMPLSKNWRAKASTTQSSLLEQLWILLDLPPVTYTRQ